MSADPRSQAAGERRGRAVIERELREVERYLGDMPPHSGSGFREDLRTRLDRLRRELGALGASPHGDG